MRMFKIVVFFDEYFSEELSIRYYMHSNLQLRYSVLISSEKLKNNFILLVSYYKLSPTISLSMIDYTVSLIAYLFSRL